MFNVLVGAAGDDTLNGGNGSDQLTGGIGNDISPVDSTSGRVRGGFFQGLSYAGIFPDIKIQMVNFGGHLPDFWGTTFF